MKKLLFIPILLTYLLSYGQDKEYMHLVQEADNYLKYEQYTAAIPLYEEALELQTDNPEVNYNLAECYRLTFRYEDAQIYYGKVAYLAGPQMPLSFYYQALMQKFGGNYEESIVSFDKFLDLTDGSGRYPLFTEQAFIEQAGALNALQEEAKVIYSPDLISSPINTPFNEFGSAHLSPTDMWLTSGRTNSGKHIDTRYGEAFTNLYHFKESGAHWEDVSRSTLRQLNYKYNNGSGVFNYHVDQYYYTVCGEERPECMIYVSRKNNKGEWDDPVPLDDNINRPGYDTKQPAISYTGDSLFFVSDRPGGHGQSDIWMSVKENEKHWGPAVNLGPSVNTSLNEVSPCTSRLSGILLFSSNGHQGYGGYDLYFARRLSSGDTTLLNIGQPFNSARDDLYPELYGESFFWSSNRPGGQGQFDIYSAQTGTQLKFISRLSLLKRSAKRGDVDLNSRKSTPTSMDLLTMVTQDKLEYSKLPEEEQLVIDQLVNGEAADEVLSEYSAGKQHALQVLADRRKTLLDNAGRILMSSDLSASGETQQFDLSGKLVVSQKRILPQTRLYLKNEQDEILMITGVAEDGTFRFSNVRGGGKVKIEPDPNIYEENGKLAVQDFEITEVIFKTQRLENIYFDLDKYFLRPEAAISLVELSRKLINYPKAQLEIFAYADNTGSDAYNLMLTRRRGQSVYDFMVAEGVMGSQLLIRPKGKEESTENIQDGLGRQHSRRVEFTLHGVEERITSGATTCFTTEAMEFSSLLQLLHLDEEMWVELNGERPESMRRYQPVRLDKTPDESVPLSCPEAL